MHFFFVIVLSLHVGYSLTTLDSSQKLGSHNLLKLEKSNDSVQRPVRCTPCEKETNLKRPVSNHLDPEYRGNGADNLGYDWSPMAWGGPAFPQKSKVYMGGMRGGRMMVTDGGKEPGSIKIICDTCRAYWSGERRNGGSSGRNGNRGRQLDMSAGQNYYGDQPGYWQGNKMRIPEEYETRVMSPTVGVLVKPGSRIAYIPSRSGEMLWDGVSGGGTRWDGFSNGISWIGGNDPEWDRSDSEPRDGASADSLRRGSDYPYGSNAFGPWDGQKRPSNWGDNSGKGYYFTNGVPNDIDPRWKDRGYASNWHYGSTNQDGWNGSNMKWNYGGKQWTDNDRAANRFYFNSPQDRTYVPSDGQHRQYGNQYPNYQAGAGYPSGFRPQPSRPAGGGYRPNDRFPASFQQGNYGGGDKDRPWDYTSRDPYGYQRPRPRPEWARPGPSYPTPGNQVDNYGKFPGPYRGYDKFSPSDKNDYEKPWTRPSGYGPSQPGPTGGFPYGGNRYPEEPSGGVGRPSFPPGGGHLFFPNEGNQQPNYPGVEPGSGENRPTYPSGNRKPGEYPSSGNQIGTFSGDNVRPSPEYPDEKRPSIIYTGGRPSGVGGATGGYFGSGGSSGGYPSTESSVGGYPSDGGLGGTYPGGSRPTGYPGISSGYPSGGSSYPSGGSRPGGFSTGGSYPESGGRPTGFIGSGSRPDKYYGSGDLSVGYQGGGGSSYPQSSGASGGGASYSSGTSRPGFYPSEGYPSSGNFGGGRPTGYPGEGQPGGGRPTGYPGVGGPGGGTRPIGYPGEGRPGGGGGRPTGYPGEERPGGGSRPTGYPGEERPGGGSRPTGYPGEERPGGGGRPTGYPGEGRPGLGYPSESNRPGGYPSGGRPNYPVRGPSLYPGAESGGSKNPPKGYYTGFITEISPNDGQSQYGTRYPNYFGSSYPGDKNFYPGKDRDKYYGGGSQSNGYAFGEKTRFPGYSGGEDRYSGGGSGGSGYPTGSNDRGSDKYYYGQSDMKGKYPGGFPSNHRYPNGGTDEFDRNQGSSSDKNSWNYGQNEHKDGIYRRSGGSYPPYRGGQYYTSSYLASMSTTAGSTQAGTEPKTQSVTKADEVTQPTSDSS